MFENKKRIFITLVVLVLVVSGLAYFAENFDGEDRDDISPALSSLDKVETLQIGNVLVNIEIANTDEERMKGLSGRVSLAEDSGLLFVFPRSDTYGFWMKEMRFPIDIIWIDEDFNVVHIEESLSPETYPQVFVPLKPALYALEVNAGFAAQNNIELGSKVEFSQIFGEAE